MPEQRSIDIEALRKRLSHDDGGRRYWRSLEELADTPEFRQLLENEFPAGASQWDASTDRRRFLQIMGASLALAGVSGCFVQPEEKIVPYVDQPEQIVPGKPLYFATAMPLGGVGLGVLVESHMGRPTKIEGNPEHPASLGATDSFAQASVLGLYDPDRSQAMLRRGQIATWDRFVTELRAQADASRGRGGAGLRLLTETISSPSLAAQIRGLLEEFPEARWHQYQPVGRDLARRGALLAFGRDANPVYQLEAADVVLLLDSDLLASGPGSVRYARHFAQRRGVSPERTEMNRLYVVESTVTPSGAIADHRLGLKPSHIEAFIRALAARLGVSINGEAALPAGVPQAWLDALADDLPNGRSLIVAGPSLSPDAHALVHAMNAALGNVGATVTYTEPTAAESIDQTESITELVADMQAGQVELLIMLGGNPAFDAPADLDFAAALSQVPLRIHHSLYADETSRLCQWHIPASHYLESWGDVRAFDGSVSIIQPLIAPLYATKTPQEVLAALHGEVAVSPYDRLREYWQGEIGEENFEPRWHQALHDGLIPDSASPALQLTVSAELAAQLSTPVASAGGEDTLELVLRPHPTVYDGRFANNGWLQELPQPLTKLTWDNAALVSPATGARLNITGGNDDGRTSIVKLERAGREVNLPVWITPGVPDGTVTVYFGQGRRIGGRVAQDVGVDTYPLRTRPTLWTAAGARLTDTGRKHSVACTQHHHLMHDRHLVQSGTLAEYRAHPEHPEFMHHPHGPTDISMYPEWEYEGYKWGMSIDLGKCLGCSACVVACQAENNIPVVGKDQVLAGREMHWLRIDTYYAGDVEQPETFHQPVPCMHCEKAPCEPVCPVAATTHGSEGLNEMVYNRCVGTRYCSNNCPYKVRRFNFLQFSDTETPSLQPLYNPDVTVRNRGVMEKCTYCVQRINSARIDAEKERRTIRDGEVRTACQAACPTQAIVFGNLNDSAAEVTQRKQLPLEYELLPELNTKPRTTYTASVRNPNPALASAPEHS